MWSSSKCEINSRLIWLSSSNSYVLSISFFILVFDILPQSYTTLKKCFVLITTNNMLREKSTVTYRMKDSFKFNITHWQSFYAYSNPDSAVSSFIRKDVGALLRLSRVWALALPCTRISNSIAHAEIYWDCHYKTDSIQYTQCERFGCVLFLYFGICEIHTQKITFVTSFYHKSLTRFTLAGYSSRCKVSKFIWTYQIFEKEISIK